VKSDLLKLYYAPHTCSLATHIALEDAGAVYQLKRVDFAKKEQQQPDYLAINPKARVPALVTPRGVLTETPAMLVYVAQTYPGADLAPIEDPFAFADLQAANSYLGSSLHVAHAHRMRGHRWTDDSLAVAAMKRFVPESVSECYRFIEHHLLKGPWVMGRNYTIADPYLFTIAQWLEDDGVDPKRFPKVIEHRQSMLERSAVEKAIREETGG
jgi:glutathione S-transferase